MKKTKMTFGLAAVLLMILMGTVPGFGASNVALEERIAKLEKKAGEDTASSPLGQISEWVTLSGTIEIEAGFESSDVNDSDNSDVSLATAELGIEAAPQDWVTGFLLLCWEDEDDKFTADEAHITLGATDQIPYYLSAGRLYVPFGAFETMMVSDPVTQDLAEIRDEAVQVGIEMNGIRAAAFAFNGEAEEANEKDDTIDVFGLSLGYAMETESFSLDLGVDWINNILESGGLREVYDDNGWAAALEDQVPAVAVHAAAHFGPVCLIGEYVAMTDDAMAADGVKLMDQASAYALEIGYTFDLAGYESTFALGYQGSDDAEELLPESKYLAALGVGITDNFSVNLEYSSADNYSVADGGDGDDIDTFTIQMAFEF